RSAARRVSALLGLLRAALHKPRLPLRGFVYLPKWGVRRPRRAVSGVQIGVARLRQRYDVYLHLADGSEAAAQRQRSWRHHLELPAAPDILVWAHHVRQ